MTDLALVAALAVFRVATALLLATGMGALATAAVSFLFAAGASAWVGNVTTLTRLRPVGRTSDGWPR